MATHYDTVHLSEVASTQDESRLRFDRSARPTLVVAERQFEGRGRQGRAWEQADRAMFASYTYETTWPQATRSLIPLVCGLAMREAIVDLADVDVSLKWPNDLMLGQKKLGGILVEASGSHITAGCGVNLWWREPYEGSSTLYGADPGPSAATGLAAEWIKRLHTHLARGPVEWHRDDYVAASATLGRPIVWDSGEGVASDIDHDGALVVSTPSGSVTIHAGDVHTRP
jgi:BirA family biotin operon repressor/biotin-[acetyl-CoA-carboxylase] ligase